MPFSLKYSVLALVIALTCLFCAPCVAQEGTDYDRKYAVIFAYFNVGDDSNPNINIRKEQFRAQIDELQDAAYTVLPLPDIIAAFKSGTPLPDRTIAITFDGADRSILDFAAPYLVERDIPFTVFIPAQRVNDGKPPYMTWGDLRDLKKSKLVSFGLHPSGYGRLTGASEEEIRRQINNSLSLVRKELHRDAVLLAYPYGEYDDKFQSVVKAMGFKAAFGQQSGVAYAGDDLFALPRFTLTERYGDMERFKMTANALPLPVRDITPHSPYLNTTTPAIGFTLPASLRGRIADLSCFSSVEDKPDMQSINDTRVEIRLPAALNEDRPRLNCTLPVPGPSGADETRWRWFGMLFTLNPDLLRIDGDAAPDDPDDLVYRGLE